MAKNVINSKDLTILGLLQTLLLKFVMTPDSKQRKFFETKIYDEKSPGWNKIDKWNKKFAEGVDAVQIRLHDILDAIKGKKTVYHTGGLTVAELFRLAVAIGIERDEAETTKKLLWAQIKRRMNPNLSRAETQAVFYALLKTLTEDEITWLKEYRQIEWKGYFLGNKKWIKERAITLIDCSIKIEDILCAMENHTGFDGYRGRVSKKYLLALEDRLGISPSLEKNLPKGVIKARMLLEIANKNKKQPGDKGSWESTMGIPPNWEGYIV